MVTNCLRSGWQASVRSPRLVAALWLWNALLGLVAGWGMSRWLASAFNWSPEADRALQRFQFGLLFELTQYDRFSPWTFAGGALFGLVLVAALTNVFVAAGILEVLATRDPRPLLHRFLRGAGHFFGRFLRLLIINGLALLIAWIIVAALTRPIVSAIGESSWERTWIVVGLLRLALLGAVVAAFMALLDIARVQVVTAPFEERRMLRTWIRSIPLLFRHMHTMTVIYVALGACWLVLALFGLAIVFTVTPTNWAAIWVLVGVQQLFIFSRCGIRVARAGAVLTLVRLGAEGGTAGLETGGYTVQTETSTVDAPTEPTPVP